MRSPEAMQRLLRALTVNVTSMFRDPEMYLGFRNEVIPMLRSYPFTRIWHAGCSTGGAFALSVDDPVNFARPSIDVMFQSLAEEVGPAAIAVVLSGASRDGSEGALKIRTAGGRVLVQDPEEAECNVLPQATLQAMALKDPAVVVLPLAEIAPWLVKNLR